MHILQKGDTVEFTVQGLLVVASASPAVFTAMAQTRNAQARVLRIVGQCVHVKVHGPAQTFRLALDVGKRPQRYLRLAKKPRTAFCLPEQAPPEPPGFPELPEPLLPEVADVSPPSPARRQWSHAPLPPTQVQVAYDLASQILSLRHGQLAPAGEEWKTSAVEMTEEERRLYHTAMNTLRDWMEHS